MANTEDTVSVRRSSGKVEALSADELEQLNYERKVRDQESTGRLVTPKQVNIIAVIICILVLVYAIPRLFFTEKKEESTYIPLSERSDEPEYFEDYDIKTPLSSSGLNLPASGSIVSKPIEPTASAPEQKQEPIQSSATPITKSTASPANEPEISHSEPDNSEQLTAQPIVTQKRQEQESGLEIARRAELEASATETVTAWAEDWSNQDVEAYLSHYSTSFVSEKGMGLAEWRNYRSGRVNRPDWIQVQIIDIQVDLISDSLAKARFTQNYSASNYQEISGKTLTLESTPSGWRIVSEIGI